MRKANTITVFHKKAPRKLIRLYKQNEGSCSLVSGILGVNPAQVWNLLRNGIEPRREDLRRKLLLKPRLTPEESEQKKELRLQKKQHIDSEIAEYFRKIMEVINVEDR